jgi:hypothetical protein
MIAYALARNGKLIPGTLAEKKADAYVFSVIVNLLGEPWGTKYWKRLEASRRSAAKHGIKVEKFKVVPYYPAFAPLEALGDALVLAARNSRRRP